MARKDIVTQFKDMANITTLELEAEADRIHHHVLIDGFRISISIWRA